MGSKPGERVRWFLVQSSGQWSRDPELFDNTIPTLGLSPAVYLFGNLDLDVPAGYWVRWDRDEMNLQAWMWANFGMDSESLVLGGPGSKASHILLVFFPRLSSGSPGYTVRWWITDPKEDRNFKRLTPEEGWLT